MKKENLIFVTDPDIWVGELKKEVQHVLQELQFQKESQKQNSAEYLTRADVAERFHCSLSTVHRLAICGVLKPLKFGHRTLFRASEVDSALIQLNTKGGANYAY